MKLLKHILLFSIILLLLASCKKKNEGGAMFSLVPQQPYDDPVWHPSGEIIGFNHKPIEEINYYYGYDSPMQASYTYKEDSVGFYLVNADGTNQRMVLPYYLPTPAWSNDGNWIAFSYGRQIHKMPFDGEKFDTTAIEQLTFEGNNFFPAWSPDDEWIAYDSDADSDSGLKFIWKMRKNGNNKRRIAFTPNEGETRQPQWGNNSQIVHNRYKKNIGTAYSEIYTMDTVGNNANRITENEYSERTPKFNKSYNKIAYHSQTGIYTIELNSEYNEQLLVSEAGNFSWSPDGKYVVYQHRVGNYRIDEEKGALWIINTETKEKRQLTYNQFNLLIN